MLAGTAHAAYVICLLTRTCYKPCFEFIVKDIWGDAVTGGWIKCV